MTLRAFGAAAAAFALTLLLFAGNLTAQDTDTSADNTTSEPVADTVAEASDTAATDDGTPPATSAEAIGAAIETAIAVSTGEPDEAVPVDSLRAMGPVTHLPLPRFVSMKAREGNVRRGPSLTHRIDWVFKRQDMPLQIVAEHGHWRRVRDHDGMGGWVHYSLLSGARTVLVESGLVTMHLRPDDRATVVAKLEQGVVARLGDCVADWCNLRVGPYRGWAHKAGLWGVAADELRD